MSNILARSKEVNKVSLSGVLKLVSSPRYTPSGLPVCEGSVHHCSLQNEADSSFSVDIDVPFVALGAHFKEILPSSVGKGVFLQGFWGKHGLSQNPVLHVQSFEWLAS